MRGTQRGGKGKRGAKSGRGEGGHREVKRGGRSGRCEGDTER